MTPTALSPHIRAALARMETGLAIRYTHEWWQVTKRLSPHVITIMASHLEPSEALTEYLRLTARESKGGVA